MSKTIKVNVGNVFEDSGGDEEFDEELFRENINEITVYDCEAILEGTAYTWLFLIALDVCSRNCKKVFYKDYGKPILVCDNT